MKEKRRDIKEEEFGSLEGLKRSEKKRTNKAGNDEVCPGGLLRINPKKRHNRGEER